MAAMPPQIIEAMVQCFGRAFYYKGAVSSFFLSCGVPLELNDRHRVSAKFVWARELLTELNRTEKGQFIQRRILTELCKLRDVPDTFANRDAGLDALRNLKSLALDQKLYVEEIREKDEHRTERNEERQRIAQERERTLDRLRESFSNALTSDDRQKAGYSLENILEDLFAAFGIEYRKSYRTNTQQIDGYFHFEGFDYLVEAKWRQDRPTESEIGGFKQKVDTKLQSTRGIFVSINGYRLEVMDQFSFRGGNIILIDGSHLIQILEGRQDLKVMLRKIISKAAQEGLAYTTVADI